MHKILGIGEIVVDKTYFLNEFPVEGLKFQSINSIEGVGGPVPTALKFLQNMGCEVELIGTVGDDYGAIFLKHELKKYKIKTDFIFGKSTKINTILVNNNSGERTIIKDLDRNNKIEKNRYRKNKKSGCYNFG
ncbi:MAG: carbohydrate kinase family protein [Candidatus Gracilibacteria bacterium]|nr:carbohydrate kinase family protein [Candidatus Gracilibacteria bacterium]